MIKQLLRQEWQKALRAPGYYKNLVVSIFLGIFLLYFSAIFLLLGLVLPKILGEVLPSHSPIEVFYGLMLYICIAGLSMRFLMQQLNTLNLPPYQILPIKRSSLVNYLLLKPLFNPVNYMTLLFVIPFSVRLVVSGDISEWQAAALIVAFVFIIWFDSLSASLLKRKFGASSWGILIVVASLAAIASLEYLNVFSFFDISRQLFGFLLSQPYGLLVLLLPVIGVFVLNKQFFAQNYYPEKFNRKVSEKVSSSGDFSFMSRFGQIGELIALELKLILRHKRTKSTLYSSIIFLAYGLLLYPNKTYQDNLSFLFFVAMFVTGTLMVTNGQWIISWDGCHFDCLMTKKIDTRTYIHANYTLLIASNIISFVLTTPYFLFGKQIVFYHIAAFLYNMGVNVIVYLLMAFLNTKRLELSQGSAMNFQGMSYKNFFVVLLVIVFPMVFIAVFSIFKLSEVAVIILGALGLFGLIFHKPLLGICESVFLQRKYALCDGFRKKE
ncbi:MAG: DUF5687 family protein [Dysgonamonadaceae bacterium]|nr:DUF5687 family protein [Dysgonamonadaceae bacterium]